MDVLIDCEPDESIIKHLPESIADHITHADTVDVVGVRFVGVKDFQFTPDNDVLMFTPVGEITVTGDVRAAGEESILDLQTYYDILNEGSDFCIVFPSHHFPTLQKAVSSLQSENDTTQSIITIRDSNVEILQSFSFISMPEN